MSVVSIKELFEAGSHFGHQTRRWNPKMAEFIHSTRGGTHIIDLTKTAQRLDVAYHFVSGVCAQKGEILFVGTKKQAAAVVKEEALRSGMHFVNSRWLGGMLTNWNTIRRRIRRMEQLEKMKEDGTFDKLTKKEVLGLELEMEKLVRYLGGIKDMHKLPQIMFVVDVKKEHIAVAEAKKLGIPVVAMIDSNADPDSVDFPIPANDDGIRSIKLIASVLANAAIESKAGFATTEE